MVDDLASIRAEDAIQDAEAMGAEDDQVNVVLPLPRRFRPTVSRARS